MNKLRISAVLVDLFQSDRTVWAVQLFSRHLLRRLCFRHLCADYSLPVAHYAIGMILYIATVYGIYCTVYNVHVAAGTVYGHSIRYISALRYL